MQVMAQHLHTAPPPPSSRVPAIHPVLDRVVLDCLAKRPEDRPATAAELSRRLAALDVARWTDTDAHDWWASLPAQVVAPVESADSGAVTREVTTPTVL
jgi:eukaryotic-like serine/threonine-protein kinase